jgi:Rrf2 family protein
MIYMAQMGADRPVLLREIAEAEDISPTFLHKIFRRLARNRILGSQRGVGYTLNRAPETITLLAIAEAIEGPILIRRCIVDKDYCNRRDNCLLASFWTELQEELVAKLESVTIKDLVATEK